jgi:hypothetical protein
MAYGLRVAGRGVQRKDDPVRLQRAVNEIAVSYARGGQGASGYVGPDTPLGPTSTPAQALGWADGNLKTEYDRGAAAAPTAQIDTDTRLHDSRVRQRQEQTRTVVGSPTTDDLQSRVANERGAAQRNVQRGTAQVQDTSRTQSQEYRSAVRVGSVSENHGGNPAVWATVGATASQPDLGGSPAATAPPSAPGTTPRGSTPNPPPPDRSGARPSRLSPDAAQRQQPRR